MRILSRYVLREFLVPLCYCLTGFVSIYVLFELFGSFSRIAESEIGFGTIAMYFLGYLAPYFRYLAPAALMLATLYTMWSFCRHSEIVAMRSSGISFLAIVKPLLSVAVLLALVVLYVNEVFMPLKAQWAVQLKTDRFDLAKVKTGDNVVYRNAAAARTWNVDELLADDGTKLGNVRVTIDRPGGARLKTISAERAEYLDGEWWFVNPRVQHHDALGQEIATRTPELDALKTRAFPEFRERPSDFMMQNRPWRFNSVRDRLRYIRTHRDLTPAKRDELKYDAWEQIMAPWACLIITLIAIPAGIASGRQSVFKGILGALGMYFAFYGFQILAMVLAKNGWCPPILAAMLPAAVFLVLGIRAFLKQR